MTRSLDLCETRRHDPKDLVVVVDTRHIILFPSTSPLCISRRTRKLSLPGGYLHHLPSLVLFMMTPCSRWCPPATIRGSHHGINNRYLYFLLIWLWCAATRANTDSFIAFDVPVQGDEAFQLLCQSSDHESSCQVKQRFSWSAKMGSAQGTCGAGNCDWLPATESATIAFGDCSAREACWVYCDPSCVCTLGSKESGGFVSNGTACAVLPDPPTSAPTNDPKNRIEYQLDITATTSTSTDFDMAIISCMAASAGTGTQCVVYGDSDYGVVVSNFEKVFQQDNEYQTFKVINDQQDATLTRILPCQQQQEDTSCNIACDPILCSCTLFQDSIEVGPCPIVQEPTLAPTVMTTLPPASNSDNNPADFNGPTMMSGGGPAAAPPSTTTADGGGGGTTGSGATTTFTKTTSIVLCCGIWGAWFVTAAVVFA